MAGKKERSRFSIKFNENDPMHEIVIDIPEHQGARQKAQFIANAILHYMNCPETPDIKTVQAVMNKVEIEKVVLEILRQQGEKQTERERRIERKVAPEKIQSIPVEKKEEQKVEYKKEAEQDSEPPRSLYEMAKALIADTMLVFRSN